MSNRLADVLESDPSLIKNCKPSTVTCFYNNLRIWALAYSKSPAC